MGREVVCRVCHEGRSAEVKALLETEAVILRGEIKATLPFAGLDVRAVDGMLYLNDTVLELGPQAEQWAHKILHPPTLLDKLGVKDGMRVAVLGFSDRSFMLGVPHDQSLKDSSYDSILVHTPSLNELRGLQTIKAAVGPNTALWIVYPKGRKDITEKQVFAHGKGLGLVDVKVCRFSESLTALKFVRPK